LSAKAQKREGGLASQPSRLTGLDGDMGWPTCRPKPEGRRPM